MNPALGEWSCMFTWSGTAAQILKKWILWKVLSVVVHTDPSLGCSHSRLNTSVSSVEEFLAILRSLQ